MGCRCGRAGDIARGHELLCSFCFVSQFEKRVKRALRQRELKKGERVLVVGELAAHLFKKFVHVPLDVTFSSVIKDGFDAVVTEWTLDDECVAFLEAFAAGRFEAQKHILMFQFVTDEDVMLYAKMNNLHFVLGDKSEHWQKFLSGFDLDMKYNLLRSAAELRKMSLQSR